MATDSGPSIPLSTTIGTDGSKVGFEARTVMAVNLDHLFQRPHMQHARWLIGSSKSALPNSVKLMYLWLLAMSTDGISVPWPGSIEMAALMASDRSQTYRAIKVLCSLGLVHYDVDGSMSVPLRGSRILFTAPSEAQLAKIRDPKFRVTGKKIKVPQTTSSPAAKRVRKNRVEPTPAPPAPTEPATVQPVESPAEDQPVARSRRKSRATGLTLQEVGYFTQSSERMRHYIQKGKGAFGLPPDQVAKLPSTRMDWSLIAVGGTPDPKATTYEHLAGYWWYLVSWYREKNGIQITMPSSWPMLVESVRRLGMDAKATWEFMRVLVGSFQHIQGELAARNFTVELSESTLRNSIVREQALRIQGMPEDQISSLLSQSVSEEGE